MMTVSNPKSLPLPFRGALFGALAAFLAVGVVQRVGDRVSVSGAALALVLAAMALFGPRRTLIAASVGSGAGIVLVGNGSASNIAWFGLCILVGWAALQLPLRQAVALLALALATIVLEIVLVHHDPGWAAWLAGTVFSVVGCVFARREQDLVAALHEAQAGLAQQARVEERNRIARELHDVIAHSLTVSLLHVSAARLALADDPQDAQRALAEAERLGRASLDEVRHAVGLLHREGVPDPTAPLPGSTDVPALVASVRSAGADLHATIDGDLDALPATVGLATYRILQEALTNAAKHAPGAAIVARVAVGANVSVDVDSAGRAGSGTGHGLMSMRERAAALGGSCQAGPGGSGWRVHAEIPLEPAARPRSLR